MPEHNSETVRSALVALLRKCADYLASVSTEEAEAIAQGEIELRISLNPRKGTRTPKSIRALDDSSLRDISGKLRSLESRDEGHRLLEKVAPTKAALTSLARHLDITVRKGELSNDLTRRIIESTIGYRLASAAIQGRIPSRGRDDSSVTGSKAAAG